VSLVDVAELEKLSSKELHDLAVHRAVTHVDVGFLWSLVKSVPAAEAAAGNIGDAETDVISLSGLLSDVVTADEGEVADLLRPLYIDYLRKHS
jgi:hypothetical protein